mgnify:CR=1 FL=1
MLDAKMTNPSGCHREVHISLGAGMLNVSCGAVARAVVLHPFDANAQRAS